MDPGTRRLALIAGGLGGTLLLVVGGWSAIGHHSGTVPVVQADSRPIRVKPDNPGGMQVAGANEDILSGDPDTNSGKLAPPPETPNPQAMRAPPPPPVVASPAPATAPAALSGAAKLTPDKSAAAPVKAAALPAPDKAAAADKAAVAQDKHASTAAATPAPDHNAPAAKGALVQLAAVSSEAAAKVEWQRLQKRMPDLLDHRQPAISKIDREGHTLWRVRTGGFSDFSQATVFCERVRAKGTGCSVADF
jgi:SPOR domain